MITAVEPALKFTTDMLHPNDLGNALLNFREKGYAVISSCFVRESVDEYLEQLKSIVLKTNKWWNPLELPTDNPLIVHPARAPRLRDALQTAFATEREKPSVCLQSPGWLIKPSNPDPKIVHDWHKDGDHWNYGSLDGAYTYPTTIHAVAYFTDMSLDHGPTFVVPRSHRDASQSPHDPKGFREEPFLPHKQDVVIWDQRCWHRASPRKVEGLRVMMNFAFFSVPWRTNRQTKRCAAMKQASAESTDPAEKLLFGGPFED